MAPHRIMFIRHAEKPAANEGIGIEADGKADAESLTVRGWQRAGALARFFCPIEETHAARLKPSTVSAPGSGPASQSERAMQTVAPLVALLRATSRVNYDTVHLKDDGPALMKDALAQHGVVLIAWEHKVLPSLIELVPGAPTVPEKWPEDRFDMVWILDRETYRWSFSQPPNCYSPAIPPIRSNKPGTASRPSPNGLRNSQPIRQPQNAPLNAPAAVGLNV